MTLYTYECPTHGEFRCAERADSTRCHLNMSCTLPAQRRWGFTIAASFQPHFNSSLGVAVNSQSDFNSQLARASEQASSPATVYDADGNPHEVTHAPHRFEPVDMRDKQALGVTNDGLDATYDRWKALGKDDDAKKLKVLMEE